MSGRCSRAPASPLVGGGADAHDRHPHLGDGRADRIGEEPMVVDDQDADRSLPPAGSGSSMQNSVPGRADRRPMEPP